MSAESHHATKGPVVATASDIPGEDAISRFLTKLEERVRKSPRESVLIAFLIGGLLQVYAIRSLLLNLVRLLLSLATPILFGFAAWRLYQSFEGNENPRKSSFSRQRTAAK
jgi:hypothetical protein